VAFPQTVGPGRNPLATMLLTEIDVAMKQNRYRVPNKHQLPLAANPYAKPSRTELLAKRLASATFSAPGMALHCRSSRRAWGWPD
jgi:hypothetical protein